MTNPRHKLRYWLLLTLVIAVPSGGVLGASQNQPPSASSEVRSTMRSIFEALSTAFTLSLDPEQFQAPANRGRVRDALRALAANADSLGRHGGELNPTYDFLRRSLAHDSRQILQSYEAGQYAGARFRLNQLTNACFACHSKLPSQHHFALGERFMDNPEVEHLPLAEQARLAVATRQFDRALTLYEKLFRSASATQGQTDLIGAIEDYLRISIRVRNDFTRPIANLEELRRRSDVPPYLKETILNWLDALDVLQYEPERGDLLAHARALMQQAALKSAYPADPRGLVNYMAASALLHRFVNSEPSDEQDMPEAFYLLGVAESHITSSYWYPQTQFFLERAIRLDPKGPVARRAYDFLEDYVTQEYTGSSGAHVPPEVRDYLGRLRKLVEGG